MTKDEYFMKKAILQATVAFKKDEVPIGCVIVKEGKIVARGYNTREKTQNAINHAEIIAIARACKKLGSFRLEGCTLYVTAEPCAMCCGAIIQSRIERLVFGVYEEKFGCAVSQFQLLQKGKFNHYCEFEGGILEGECKKLLKDFFRDKRFRT